MLLKTAGLQSAPTTGSTQDKKREEKELEDEAHKIGRAVTTYCTDTGDLTTAAKYDLPITSWRILRDEPLLQKARLLITDATALATGSDSLTVAGYGITPATIALLTQDADDYEKFIVAPQTAINERSILTASLRPQVRALSALFDQMDDLALQFKGTPAGDAFAAAWLASGQIIDRGHGPSDTPPPPVPPAP